MAKIKLGSNLADIRGKLNGHVFSKNRSGAYVRNKVTPVNRKTASQTASRSRFATYSSGWKSLTDENRLAWNSAVQDWKKTDIFGDSKVLSGAQLYQRLNNSLVCSGATAITSPPVNNGVLTVTLGALTAAHATPALSLVLAAAVPAGTRAIVFATAPMSPGINFVKSQLRIITNLAAAATSPVDLLTAYEAKFATIGEPGQKMFVGVVFVNSTSGLASPMQIVSAIIGA